MKTTLLANNPQLSSFMPKSRQNMPPLSSSYSQTASQTQQASILIKTKEGDTVRISENFSNMKEMAQYNYGDNQGLLNSDLMTSFVSSSTINSEFIQVDGDLNSQELADLGNLLDDLSDIAGDFFSGNFEDAVAGAMNLGDMGSLAKVDASFSNKTSLAYERSSTIYHPMPDVSADLFNDMMAKNDDLNDKDSPDNTLSMNDRLKSQWQQFLGYLQDQTDDAGEEKHVHKNHKKHHKDHDHGAKPADVGGAMFARAKDILHDNPRLSPLIPAIGDLALDKVPVTDDKHAYHDFVKDIRNSFQDAFKQWMV